MKFTLPWLKEHLTTDAPLAEIVDKLTMIGLEVENVEDKAKQYEAFKVVSYCLALSSRSRTSRTKPSSTRQP